MKNCLAFSLVFAATTLFGCNTYTTTRVPKDGSARGYPFIFQQPYLATVTYSDNTSTVHLVSVPTLYAVDAERAALGTTTSKFENFADGFAYKSDTVLDQKIPENLAAITELLKELGVKTGEGTQAREVREAKITPNLLDKPIKSIELKSLQ